METISKVVLDRLCIKLPSNIKCLLRNGTLTVYDVLELLTNTVSEVVKYADVNSEKLEGFAFNLVEWREKTLGEIREALSGGSAEIGVPDGSIGFDKFSGDVRDKFKELEDKEYEGMTEAQKDRLDKLFSLGIDFDTNTNTLTIKGQKFTLKDESKMEYVYGEPVVEEFKYTAAVDANGELATKPSILTYRQSVKLVNNNDHTEQVLDDIVGTLADLKGATVEYIGTVTGTGIKVDTTTGAVKASASVSDVEKAVATVYPVISSHGKVSTNVVTFAVMQRAASITTKVKEFNAVPANGDTYRFTPVKTLGASFVRFDGAPDWLTAKWENGAVAIEVDANGSESAREATFTAIMNVGAITISVKQAAGAGAAGIANFGRSKGLPVTLKGSDTVTLDGQQKSVSVTGGSGYNCAWVALPEGYTITSARMGGVFEYAGTSVLRDDAEVEGKTLYYILNDGNLNGTINFLISKTD